MSNFLNKVLGNDVQIKFNSGKSEKYTTFDYDHHIGLIYVESMDRSKPGAIMIPLHSIESIYVGEIE